MAGFRVGEEIDVAGDVVVEHERKIGLRGLQLGLDLRFERGVDGEGDIVGDVDRGGLDFRREAVALFQRVHLEGVDGIHDVLELGGELGVVLEVEAAAQHLVDGVVETGLGGLQVPGAIVAHARLVGLLDGVDELLVSLLLGPLTRGGSRRSRLRRGGRLGRRGSLRRRTGQRGCGCLRLPARGRGDRLLRVAPGQNQNGREAG